MQDQQQPSERWQHPFFDSCGSADTGDATATDQQPLNKGTLQQLRRCVGGRVASLFSWYRY